MKKYTIPCCGLLLPFLILLLPGCGDYLDVKPDSALIVPQNLQDYQALLDNDFYIMNQEPALGFMGADNYYLSDDDWASLFTDTERNTYIWAEEIFDSWLPQDWSLPYEQVFYANVVLEGLEELTVSQAERAEWEGLKGSALFYRSYAFYALSQHFAPPYDPNGAADTPGIPLRLRSELEAPVSRASLQETYAEIIRSGEAAAALLPEHSTYPTRPDKAAAWALLARVALIMGAWESAEDYASRSLGLRDQLLDYNSLDTAAALPFALFHEEVLFHSVLLPYNLSSSRARVEGNLYDSYAQEDLRRQLFFTEEEDVLRFRGHYSGQGNLLFGGLATDEVYLIRAESRARLGNVAGAMEDLNRLLRTRWQAGSFVPYTAASAAEALDLVLAERRKELLFRGLRWSDLRRLQGTPHEKTLVRELMGETYMLPPHSPRWVYPIPQQEIDISGIAQNPR
ncbi:RagB/SusD family nutrient uptake outer membrane protein [Cesiribacter sp. SM1]|uniref:RagB/SusD family nutrient uptake outer membrane protein n=1 Tax=Cesiribacter sp. SM1 TaxID=2861196 RepID=UPI001CD7CC90|nr:RagB/SusD family nutrient uptake outer membrane protein [Cesiribacter sp. SM1]